jgi:NAD(P)-dependent dehydrogenase (short-subunit alcohol dehydrogenase family)
MTLIAKTVADYGRLDILVNNAGISGSSVGDPDGLEGWQRVTAVNQTSVFLWAPSSPPSRSYIRARRPHLKTEMADFCGLWQMLQIVLIDVYTRTCARA